MLELLRVQRRPRRDYASTGRAPLFSPCPCAADAALVAEVFAALDMPHAAAMHAAGPDRGWSANDWRAHIAEEEDKLFPALLAAGAEQSDVDELLADHRFYLATLEGQIGPVVELPRGDLPHSIDGHGALEDALIVTFGKRILPLRCGTTKVGGTIMLVPPAISALDQASIDAYLAALQDVIDASIAHDEADAKAKTDAARKQFGGYAKDVGGSLAEDYALAVYDAGRWIATTFGPDDLKDANTDEQKSRMRDRVTSMLRKGLPPKGFDQGEQMGARDVADVVEDDQAIIAAVSPHGEGDQIAAAISSALRGKGASDATAYVKKKFVELSNVRNDTRRTMWGGATATYLVSRAGKMKPGTDDWQITHPEVEIAAAAYAASTGLSLEEALATAYQALNTYASRRGMTTPNDILGPAYKPRDPVAASDDVARWFNRNARGDAIVDAWNTLRAKYPNGGGSSPLLKAGLVLGGLGALVWLVKVLA